MQKLYFLLNECIKSYHIFAKYDPVRAAEYLQRINAYRVHIVELALQRAMFIEQLNIEPNATGYKNDVFFTHDDIDSLVIKLIAFLDEQVQLSMVQQGTREILFTRQSVAWQQLASQTQNTSTNVGQKTTFDLPQEIYLEKSQTLDFGVTGQTDAGFIFVHGANLKDDPADNFEFFKNEILSTNQDGNPNIPQPEIVPIRFKFDSNTVGSHALAVDGGDGVYSIKSERSVILTEVSINTPDMRLSLIDKGRNLEICNEVEALGVAGQFDNQYTVYYPLPYPHLLPAQDRLQLRGLNGSIITGDAADADVVFTMAFRGFTV